MSDFWLARLALGVSQILLEEWYHRICLLINLAPVVTRFCPGLAIFGFSA